MDGLNVDIDIGESTNNLLSFDEGNNSFSGLATSTNSDNTIITSSVNSLEGSAWMPLQLCYGIPLFDDNLNIEVTRKVNSSQFLSLLLV